MLQAISCLIQLFIGNYQTFSSATFLNNVKHRDDQVFKSACTSRVLHGKFSLKSKLLSKLLIGMLTHIY